MTLTMISCLVVFATTNDITGEDGLNMAGVVDHWAKSSDAIVDYEVHVRGIDTRPSEDLRDARMAVAATGDIKLDFEIQYLFQRPDRERYRRSGSQPSTKGLVQSRRVCVQASDHTRVLDEGGEDAIIPYDQVHLERRRPIRELILDPIRILVNTYGKPSERPFHGNIFALTPVRGQSINGTNCRVAESPVGHGVRIWFVPTPPHRILKVEIGHQSAKRHGHMEFVYEYNENRPSASFEFPKSWQVTVFSTKGHVRSHVSCDVLAARSNSAPPDSAFSLDVPVGALIADERKRPTEYFVQLANGVLRPIPVTELGEANLYALSASVRGSRIEGKKRTDPDSAKGGLRGLWIGLNGVAIVLIASIYYLRRNMS